MQYIMPRSERITGKPCKSASSNWSYFTRR